MPAPYQMNFTNARRQSQARQNAPAPAPAATNPWAGGLPAGQSAPLPNIMGNTPTAPTYSAGTRNYYTPNTPPVGSDPLSQLAGQQQRFNQRGMPTPSRANLLPAQQQGIMQRLYGGMRGNPGAMPMPPMYSGQKGPGLPRLPARGGSVGMGQPMPVPGMGGGYRPAVMPQPNDWRSRMGYQPNPGQAQIAASIYGNPGLTAQQQAAAMGGARQAMPQQVNPYLQMQGQMRGGYRDMPSRYPARPMY